MDVFLVDPADSRLRGAVLQQIPGCLDFNNFNKNVKKYSMFVSVPKERGLCFIGHDLICQMEHRTIHLNDHLHK